MNQSKQTTRKIASLVLLAGCASTVATLAGASPVSASGMSQAQELPESITLTGVVRDFREKNAEGGHPDFERRPSGGFGQYIGMVSDYLDDDGKPMFNSTGLKLGSQWRDANNQNIIPSKDYIASREGDQAGSLRSNEGALTTPENFKQWFRNTPGVNAAKQLDLTLVRQPGSNVYTFDDKTAVEYENTGGFFPVNEDLYGNSAGNNKNFHFTFELQTQFVYERDAGLEFKFVGDDDVWVFIDGRLVIDIGGVHSAVTQTIDLDRLDWLEDGSSYTLSFFFAERHRTQSNFRIETTLKLRNVELPPTAALYD